MKIKRWVSIGASAFRAVRIIDGRETVNARLLLWYRWGEGRVLTVGALAFFYAVREFSESSRRSEHDPETIPRT